MQQSTNKPIRQISRRTFTAAAAALALGSRRLLAEEPASPAVAAPKPAAAEIEAMRYLSSITGGGKQFWADEYFFREYLIQRNVLTHHYRLLDGKDLRQASGSFDACREKLDEIRKRDNLLPMEGKAVIILHGLFRNSGTMRKLRSALTAAGGYSVFCMGYPTTRGAVVDHAHSLGHAITSLEGISEINFVAHSLGNLVVRHYLYDLEQDKRTLPDGQKFGRMVMLAPPNHQPKMATTFVRGAVAEFVAGAAAREMATGWEKLEPTLATPPFEFGILAGGKGDAHGYNPLIPGDDDAVITVESTRLVGARDFRILPVLHSVFMNDAKVQELTLKFLNDGHFETEETRQPVVA